MQRRADPPARYPNGCVATDALGDIACQLQLRIASEESGFIFSTRRRRIVAVAAGLIKGYLVLDPNLIHISHLTSTPVG